MKDLSAMVVSCNDIGEFWSNWQKILAEGENSNSPFSNLGVVITYSSGDERSTVSVLGHGVMAEVYPCLPGESDHA